ncbi:MAG: PLP-dependent aspartate aminotransferase family protein [Oscillospiraceae bacterium]|jgi:cystathionine beta-lyase/cystathionine gamma-synthase|nr:PLP-dependent aspartate aminotransferase family protein [Oscillospiraceae bacterium]
MDFKTECVHGGGKTDATGAIAGAIYQTATFAHPGVGLSTGYDYARGENPTRAQLERTVAALEGGTHAIAFTSGMAAITAFFDEYKVGDHIVATDDLYGGTHRLFALLAARRGVSFTFVHDADELDGAVRENTRAIYIETPTNPMMQVIDIAKCAEVAKRNGVLLVVDNTFLTPYFQRPLELGADVVLHSATKYLGGHNDTLAGIFVTNRAEIAERVTYMMKTSGAVLSPFDSFLILRGIKTLALRMERQQENALALAEWLLTCPDVQQVFYPGLPSHPGHELIRKQASGYGAMLSMSVTSREVAERVLKKVQLIQYAESLGGVDSLITYPMLQTHADIPAEEREAKGINDRLLRFSVGIEDANDLIADLAQAFGG